MLWISKNTGKRCYLFPLLSSNIIALLSSQWHIYFVCFDYFRSSQNFSVMSRQVLLGWPSFKQGLTCLAQGHNAVTLQSATLCLESSTEPLSSLSQRHSFKLKCDLGFESKTACLDLIRVGLAGGGKEGLTNGSWHLVCKVSSFILAPWKLLITECSKWGFLKFLSQNAANEVS